MIDAFYQSGAEFLKQLLAEADEKGIDLANWDIDHLCYRTETIDRYNQLKNELQSFAELLIESEVNGRPIATFHLHEPFAIQHRSIYLLELPAPKKSKPVKEGFEHIEVVTPLPLTELQSLYSNLDVDDSGLAKTFNQELEIRLSSGAIKFHNLSLASVVQLEGNKKVFGAIKSSRVLEVLSNYGVQVVGTFPLGIETPESDVDLVASTLSQVELKTVLEKEYGSTPGFQSHFKLKGGIPALVVRFSHEGVKFEVFAQDSASVEQVAFRHFQIEERLLKLGGAPLRNDIQSLRAKGLKTEPAFAEALELQGDPYDAILQLSSASESELQLILNQAGY